MAKYTFTPDAEFCIVVSKVSNDVKEIDIGTVQSTEEGLVDLAQFLMHWDFLDTPEGKMVFLNSHSVNN